MSPVFYPYSCDSRERLEFLASAAVIALGLAYLLHWSRNALSGLLEIPWYLETPTYAAMTWTLYALASRHAWKWSWFRFLFRVQIPDLNGEWKGELISSHDPKTAIPCTLKIEQTWNSIGLIFATAKSESSNGITGISVKSPGGAKLVYEYSNIPRAIVAGPTMHRHTGTQWLTLSINDHERKLTGDYYTGRDRQTYGAVELRMPQGDHRKPI